MSIQIIDIPKPEYRSYITYNNYFEEYRKSAKTYKIRIIYRWISENGNYWLGFLHGGLFHVFEIPKGYHTYEECFQAISEGFPCSSCSQWKILKEMGYRNEKQVNRDRGSYGLDQWITIKSNGYDSCDDFDNEKVTAITAHNEDYLISNNHLAFDVAVVDGNNISYVDYVDVPKLRNIVAVYEKLMELGVTPYVVVSAALRHRVDDPVGLVEFMKQDDVAEAPAERSDDFFVIQLALERKAFIVSNDRFNDWKKANPDLAQEIENRRVALTFIDDDPQFDYKLYKMIRRPIQRNNGNRTKPRTNRSGRSSKKGNSGSTKDCTGNT